MLDDEIKYPEDELDPDIVDDAFLEEDIVVPEDDADDIAEDDEEEDMD